MDLARPTLAAGFAQLADTDGLVLDLRACRRSQWRRAHMVDDPVQLTDGYQISIPDRQPATLRTGGDWERTGGTLDVAGGDDPLFIARQLPAPSKSSG